MPAQASGSAELGSSRPTPALPPVLELHGVSKSFGPTFANRDLSVTIRTGEIVGLIGANGAGKSTLMRIVAGVVPQDAGTMTVAGQVINPQNFSPAEARRRGIRLATQELSLCDSLTVVENFLLEVPQLARGHLRWRRSLGRIATAAIEAIFPSSGIDVNSRIRTLAIAHRQMVEIARAASDPALRLLILDEPTSSLDPARSGQLRTWVASQAAAGRSIIFISHKLHEVAAVADRLLVMRNGSFLVSPPGPASVQRMIALMTGDAVGSLGSRRGRNVVARVGAEALVHLQPGRFSQVAMPLRRGEIVGIAGLEGSGQRDFLRAVFDGARGGKHHDLTCAADAAYVSGDRVTEGTFPLWTVRRNASLGVIARRGALSWLRERWETDISALWLRRVGLDVARTGSPMLELSGGNQQKVLMARALMTDASILLLDDPTRGVDVIVKQDFYRLIDDASAAGKLVLWYSSEDVEFLECDRVFVFHAGAVAADLLGAEVTPDALVNTSFQRQLEGVIQRQSAQRPVHDLSWLIPPVTVMVMAAVIGALNANAATLFGADLLVTAALPLLLLSMAQMFVVGGSEIDLGVGAFASLINVLSATFLVESALLGWIWVAGALAAYCGLGLLIRLRRIPAIVVTLGGSFVWVGLGYDLQPTPGGSSPPWLAAVAEASPLGVPVSLWVVVVATAAAMAVNASRRGAVLRGFGANPLALEHAGWSPLAAYAARYGIAGLFTIMAGLAMTAINTASDIYAGSAYTLLSVASIVIGGCALTGGRIFPFGVACGALTISLIGNLLGFLGVSTDYNAAVQGGILIATLAIRSVGGRWTG